MRTLFLSWVFSVFFTAAGLAEPPLQVNSGLPAELTAKDGSGMLDQVVVEAFRRIGRAVEIEILPPKRGIALTDAGQRDGHYLRAIRVIDAYPNLVYVPEAIANATRMAVTREAYPAIRHWRDLKGRTVGYWLGEQAYTLSDHGLEEAIRVPNPLSLLEMLQRGRVDVALSDFAIARATMEKAGITGLVIHQPPLERVPVYLCLHKKHANLIPGLIQALKAMIQDGSLGALCPYCQESLNFPAPVAIGG
ncbi:substrate-binding periplasmic protein [Aestuariispira insulae]|nr:transporter substrate-binding domain-containing protein [Aestuariispira insulae]